MNGGFLMESGLWARVQAAIACLSGGRILPSSIGIHPPPIRLRANALTSSLGIPLRMPDPQEGRDSLSLGLAVREEGSGTRGFRENLAMQIIIFPVNIYKFTGFFDKFLKIISPVNDCNKTGYYINLSVLHSDPAVKKVFRRPRICPQLPAFPPAPHRALKPSFINRV